jgi:hypothetical protein
MGDRVRANDRTAQLSELGRHGAFAGGNTANDSDDRLFPGIAHG